VPRDEALTLRKMWEMSKAWYHDWLSPSFRGRTAEEHCGSSVIQKGRWSGGR
jgi:hypothetical protein